jgi:hypothetical protein
MEVQLHTHTLNFGTQKVEDMLFSILSRMVLNLYLLCKENIV